MSWWNATGLSKGDYDRLTSVVMLEERLSSSWFRSALRERTPVYLRPIVMGDRRYRALRLLTHLMRDRRAEQVKDKTIETLEARLLRATEISKMRRARLHDRIVAAEARANAAEARARAAEGRIEILKRWIEVWKARAENYGWGRGQGR